MVVVSTTRNLRSADPLVWSELGNFEFKLASGAWAGPPGGPSRPPVQGQTTSGALLRLAAGTDGPRGCHRPPIALAGLRHCTGHAPSNAASATAGARRHGGRGVGPVLLCARGDDGVASIMQAPQMELMCSASSAVWCLGGAVMNGRHGGQLPAGRTTCKREGRINHWLDKSPSGLRGVGRHHSTDR